MRSLALFLACWSASALAGTTDDRIADSRYVEYARGFAAYTAQLVGVQPDGTTPHGTCVLIADRWALTAAHVVDDLASGTVHASTGIRRIERVFQHADYNDDSYGWDDIAAVQVAESFGLDFYPRVSGGNESAGDTVSMAGYGATGRLSTGYTHADGHLRAGTSTVTRFERGVIVCPARSPTSLPLCIAPGDSGGPLFCRGKLAGIASFTMKRSDGSHTRSRAGEEACHTRLILYHDWLHDVMGKDFDQACGVVDCDRVATGGR